MAILDPFSISRGIRRYAAHLQSGCNQLLFHSTLLLKIQACRFLILLESASEIDECLNINVSAEDRGSGDIWVLDDGEECINIRTACGVYDFVYSDSRTPRPPTAQQGSLLLSRGWVRD